MKSCLHNAAPLLHSAVLVCMCIAQAEGEGLVAQAEHGPLHRQLWARQHAALKRVQPDSVAAAAALRRAVAEGGSDLQAKPDFLQGSSLYPHQLQVASSSCRHALHLKHACCVCRPV